MYPQIVLLIKRLSIEVPLLSKSEFMTISSEIKSLIPDVLSVNSSDATGENRLNIMFDRPLELRERSGLVNKIRNIVEENSLPF